MRTLAVLSLLLVFAGCTPPPDVRITGGAKAKAAPAEPSHPDLAAGLKAYNVGDHERALKEFRDAAEKGNADAQFYTGLMYAEGEGAPRSYEEAVKWYEKAAAQNHPDALFALAKLHVIGGGVPHDSARALELYERAEKAYPPGEKREQVAEQRLALAAVMQEKEPTP